MTKTGVGARLRRKEDDRFLHGRGQYIADIRFPRMREVAFVRSPVAHARLIGVRVPDHPVARALVTELGAPILSTTLILPGQEAPLNDAAAIHEALATAIDLVIDAGPCPATPTTVVDLAQTPPVIVRLGLGDPSRLGLVVAGRAPGD